MVTVNWNGAGGAGDHWMFPNGLTNAYWVFNADSFTVTNTSGWTIVIRCLCYTVGAGYAGNLAPDPLLLHDGESHTFAWQSANPSFEGCSFWSNDSPGPVNLNQVYAAPAPPDHCLYGSEPKPTAPAYWTFSDQDVQDVYGSYAWFVNVWNMGQPGIPQKTADLCALPPPTDLPTQADWDGLGIQDVTQFSEAHQRFANLLRWNKWASLCQCKAGPGGSPPPWNLTPPPAPAPPAGYPLPPTLGPCTTIGDVCGVLGLMQAKLASIQQLVQLQQRWRLPFAYTAGLQHLGLTGTGDLVLDPKALGVQVVLTQVVPGRPVLEGNPVYLFDQGWLSISSPEGLLEEKRLTRQSMVWLPEQMPLATKFSYQLNAGAIVSIVELHAEP